MSEDITHFGKFSRVEVCNLAKSKDMRDFDGTDIDFQLEQDVTATVIVAGDKLVLELRRVAHDRP